MVLKAMKNSLKRNCQKKHFCQKEKSLKKTNSDKKIFWKFSEVQIFPEVRVKNNEFRV